MSDIGLFTALNAKLDYLNKRQEIVAQNIANADTPGYRPQDLTPVDFGALMKDMQAAAGDGVRLETTDPKHMLSGGVLPGESHEGEQKMVYEVAPIGNAVNLEEQLLNANKVKMDYNLMLNLYQKNLNLLRVAIGQNAR